MRYVGIALVCLILGGCAIPLPLSVASFVVGTGSALSTGKSVPEHFLSFVREQDCAMWHVVKGERICQQLPAEEVIAIREQKRQGHRGLFTQDEAKSFEIARLPWTPNAVDEPTTGASAGSWRNSARPAAPAIAAAPTLQLAARSGPQAGAPMYLLAPAYTPPSPVIIAEAAEASKGARPPSIEDRPAADSDLPMIPVAPSAGRPATVLAVGGTGRGSPIENISSMIALTADVDASGFAGIGIEIPPDQNKIELSGQASMLTTDDPEVARRLDAIKRMQAIRTAAVGGTQAASLPLPEPPVPAATPETRRPTRAGMSPAAGQALKAIIGQGVPEAGVAAVPAPVGESELSADGESRADLESGIDKVKSLFAPKRQTVFGETLVAEDGLPALPPLAAAPARPDHDNDPVVLPEKLARIAPALGGAAVVAPAKDDPSSAYAESTARKQARQPAAADSPIKDLPSITAMVVPSWQPVADRQRAAPSTWPAVAAERPRQIVPGRYLIIGSFLRKANAEHLASRQQEVSAAVVSTEIKGKTWHRVAVPDRADIRSRVAAAGITDYWILKM